MTERDAVVPTPDRGVAQTLHTPRLPSDVVAMPGGLAHESRSQTVREVGIGCPPLQPPWSVSVHSSGGQGHAPNRLDEVSKILLDLNPVSLSASVMGVEPDLVTAPTGNWLAALAPEKGWA